MFGAFWIGDLRSDWTLQRYAGDVVMCMARYARQDIERVSSWPLQKLWARWDTLRRILDNEGASPEDE